MIHQKATILITGATSGFGEAIARLLAKEWRAPLTLILAGRREDRLRKLQTELQSATVQVKTACFDIQDSAAVENFAKHYPHIDVLVNNAGLAAGLNNIQEGSLKDWEAMIDTNIKGLLYITRAVLPGMVARKAGHVVNMGSVAGRELYPKGNVYAATKHAVAALSDSMRIDTLGSNVRVTNVAPGKAETEFSLVRYKGDEAKAKAEYAGMRALQPVDVAEAVLWSLSRPAHVNIQEILIMPTDQASARDLYRAPT
jgi:NADP-dependent 3-hydroxy acid dehydrogenase YdfG